MPVGFKPSGACRFACGRGVYGKSAWEGARHEGLRPDQSKASKRPRLRSRWNGGGQKPVKMSGCSARYGYSASPTVSYSQ